MKFQPPMKTTTADFTQYGPLAVLIGSWKGDRHRGLASAVVDIERPYCETLVFEAVGAMNTAGSEPVYALKYQQAVSRKDNPKAFHKQMGYWLWSPSKNTVMQSFAIASGVSILAGGLFDGDIRQGKPLTLAVSATLGDPDWGIIQSRFMTEHACTLAFSHSLRVEANKLTYQESTLLDMGGKIFDHADGNTLMRQPL